MISSQWYYTKQDLLKTPSVLDGYDLEREKVERLKGCTFINSVGMALKLPQITLASAAIFFHRFYMRQSLKRYHYYEVGATALYLASKVEESPRHIKDVCQVCAQRAHKDKKIDLENEINKWRHTIVYTEEVMLQYLCFDMSIDHPYKYLAQMTDDLKTFTGSHRLSATAWAFLNDSLRSTACLIYHPKTITAAALYLASKLLEYPLEGEKAQRLWTSLQADFGEVQQASSDILDLYNLSHSIFPKQG